MTTRKPISWFLTEQGRRFSFAIVTGTGIALTAVRYTPHTFFIDKYRDYVRYYSAGKPVELSEPLQQRFNKCLDILNLSDVHKSIVKPFSVYGFDLFHAGSTSSKFGAQIGIPVNFNYKSHEDIEKDNVLVNQKRIELTTEAGSKLSEALILPEKVQEFAICREILMTHNSKIMFDSAYPFTAIFFVYNLSSYLNRKLNLYAAPTALRSIMYSITGLFGVGIYFLFKDMTEVHYEARTDEALSKLGPDFIESGIIFYEKLLARNQALRELMGSEGERKYTTFGNENYGIRQPHIALVHRKQFFENMLKEHKSESSGDK